jgi:hypothetical protein
MSVRCLIEITRHTPYLDAVSADEDSRGIWILFHGLRHAMLELLSGGVLDDRHLQSVWILEACLEVDSLEITVEQRPVCLAVSPGMNGVMCVCYLIISLSSARHACSSQFNLALLASHMSRALS